MGRKEKIDRNRQIDNKKVKQVLVSTELHRLIKLKAAGSGMSIKKFLEIILTELLTIDELQL